MRTDPLGVSSSPRPTCNGCRHFVVTYDPTWRYACRLFGFRARQHPAVEVLKNSGSACRGREAREEPRTKPASPRDGRWA